MRVYRASSLGYSLENLVAPFLGYGPIPPPAWLQEKFDEGKEIEPKCVEKLRDNGWMIQVSQDEVNAVGDNQIEVELEVIPGVAKIVGHLDGMVHIGPELTVLLPSLPAILEVKSMAHKSWLEFDLHGWSTPGIIQKYKWQASSLMLATGLPHILVAWDKETEELSQVETCEPFYSISDIANKLSQAEAHIEAGTIPEGCTDYPCPYFYLHEVKEEPEPADGQLDGLMNAWLEANRKAKIYKGEADALREMIVEYVGQEGKARVKGSQGVSVSVSWQEEQEVSYTKKGGWVTTVSAPRKGKGADG